MKKTMCVALLVAMVLLLPAVSVHGGSEASFNSNLLIGEWTRMDYGGGCKMTIQSIGSSGELKIQYVSPRGITLKVLEASLRGNSLSVRIVHPNWGELWYKLSLKDNRLEGKEIHSGSEVYFEK